MSLPAARKRQLSELAEFLADDYCPGRLVEPEAIAKAEGLTFSFGHYEKAFDGLIEHYRDRFHIYINLDRLEHQYSPRARFTFAHELGHFYIDEHRNALASGQTPVHPSFTNFQSTNVVEREADFFAACLLLPEGRVKTDCFRRKFSFRILEELAAKYQTSLTSTAIRFAEIGNHPLLVVYVKNGKVQWKWGSEDFPFWRIRGSVSSIRGLAVPEDTAAGEFYADGASYKETQRVFAGDWFDVRDADYERPLLEHCVTSPGQSLSIIWEP